MLKLVVVVRLRTTAAGWLDAACRFATASRFAAVIAASTAVHQAVQQSATLGTAAVDFATARGLGSAGRLDAACWFAATAVAAAITMATIEQPMAALWTAAIDFATARRLNAAGGFAATVTTAAMQQVPAAMESMSTTIITGITTCRSSIAATAAATAGVQNAIE
jgi:hypothetical protein